MEKAKILKQIMELPEKSRVLIGYDEMAKELQTVMGDGERVEGLVDACEKVLEDLIKGGKMLRSFMAVTNKNIYLISREKREKGPGSGEFGPGRMTVISRKCVVQIAKKEISAEMKKFYDREIEIITDSIRYEIYIGTDFERYLPRELGKGEKG